MVFFQTVSVSVSVSQVELLLRIAVFGRAFFYNEDRWWNLLDFAPRMPSFRGGWRCFFLK